MKKISKNIIAGLVGTFLFSTLAHADVAHVSSLISQKFHNVHPQISYIPQANLYQLDFDGKMAYTNENVDYVLVGGNILVSTKTGVTNINKLSVQQDTTGNTTDSKPTPNPTVESGKSVDTTPTTASPEKSTIRVGDGTDRYLSNLGNSTDNNERLFYINSQYTNLTSTGVDLPDNTPHFITKGFPLSDAVKIVYGKGERKIVVLADPDCPYCQEFQKNIDTANPNTLNLTMYVVPNPLSIHPNAQEKVDFLWCQPDKSAAWKSWMDYTSLSQDDSETAWSKWLALSGRVANPTCEQHVSQKVLATAKELGFNSTPTILFTNGAISQGAISLNDFTSALDYVQNNQKNVYIPKNLPENLR